MTNTIYVRPIYIDESSIEGSEYGEGSDADVVVSTETIIPKEAKLAAIRMNCFGFANSATAVSEEEKADVQNPFFTPDHNGPMTMSSWMEEKLQKIFKLCGFGSEEYWRKLKPWHKTIVKPQEPHKQCIAETFKDFPPSSLPLIETLLAIDPVERETASAALSNKFFMKKPDGREPSILSQNPSRKEMGKLQSRWWMDVDIS